MAAFIVIYLSKFWLVLFLFSYCKQDHGVATNQENVPPVGASSSGIANVSNPEDSMGPLKNVQMVANPAAATNSKSEESSMDVN